MADQDFIDAIAILRRVGTRCYRYGHGYDDPRRRRHDCADDQCRNPDCVTFSRCDAVQHDIADLLARIDGRVTEATAPSREAFCPLCDGDGCDSGCARFLMGCQMANAGPDSHKVCNRCGGSGRIAAPSRAPSEETT